MITVRKSSDRGHAHHGWLESYHTFSFADYIDRDHVQFRTLRVINEDFIEAGMGFGTHPHSDMEILTYVISGTIAHKDSMGNEFQVKAGEIQIMSAGTGITHSEFNASQSEPLHLYQIWMLPKAKGLQPRYDQVSITEHPNDVLAKIGSPEPIENGVQIMQDVALYTYKATKENTLNLQVSSDRHAWVQVVKGQVDIAGNTLGAGDAVGISEEADVQVSVSEGAEFLLFDLA